MDNQTSVSIKFTNSVTGEAKLQKYAETLKTINAVLSGMNTGQSKMLDESAKSTSSVSKDIKEIGERSKIAFNFSAIRTFANGLANVAKSLAQLTTLSSDYIENVNLLEVAYSKTNESVEESSAEVKKFIATMSEVYGFDESRLTRSLGIFKQMANAMQLPKQAGEELSEMMLKMSNDISSLYNISLDRASNALQSALVG